MVSKQFFVVPTIKINLYMRNHTGLSPPNPVRTCHSGCRVTFSEGARERLDISSISLVGRQENTGRKFIFGDSVDL
jgi:hypothetical protein